MSDHDELERLRARIRQLESEADLDPTDETVPKGYRIWERDDGITGYCWNIPSFVDAGGWWPTRALAAADARRHARILFERAAVSPTPGVTEQRVREIVAEALWWAGLDLQRFRLELAKALEQEQRK